MPRPRFDPYLEDIIVNQVASATKYGLYRLLPDPKKRAKYLDETRVKLNYYKKVNPNKSAIYDKLLEIIKLEHEELAEEVKAKAEKAEDKNASPKGTKAQNAPKRKSPRTSRAQSPVKSPKSPKSPKSTKCKKGKPCGRTCLSPRRRCHK
jgi:hypothetical protein